MVLKEMYKVEIEPHNLFYVDNRRIHVHTHSHNYVFTIGQWKTWYFGVGIKQAAIYVLYMVNLKLPSNVLNHILLLLWGRGSKLCIYLLHSVVKILKYLVMCSLEVGGSWNNMPIITLCSRFEIWNPLLSFSLTFADDKPLLFL